MSTPALNKKVLQRLQKTSGNWFRDEANRRKDHVLYADPSNMMEGIKKQVERKQIPKPLAEKFISEFISYIRNKNIPIFDSESVLQGRVNLFKITPANKDGIGLISLKSKSDTGKKNAFLKIKAVIQEAEKAAKTKLENPAELRELTIDPGHVAQFDSGSTPALLRSKLTRDLFGSGVTATSLREAQPGGSGDNPTTVRSTSRVFEKDKEFYSKTLGEKKTIQQLLAAIEKLEKEIENEHIQYGAKFTKVLNAQGRIQGSKLEYTIIIPQDSYTNRVVLKGNEAKLGNLVSDVLGLLEPASLEGSDNIEVMLSNLIRSTGKGKPIVPKKTIATVPLKSKKVGYRNPLKKENVSKQLRSRVKFPKPKKPKVVPVNVLKLKALINSILAKTVEEQMGDSTDAPIKLRYQTGRFAESALLLTLTRNQAGILAGTYTYQRDPYDVFLPGHRLGTTPQRDPRIYVEGGVREAALSILKNRFPGIALELK